MIIQKKHNDKSGFVSIMVVGIIAVLVTLIVLAFARLANRELRQSLDRQLSAQAQYAAETGLNDAVKNLSGILSRNPNGIKICSDGTAELPLGGKIGNTGAEVTCMLIEPNVPNIKVDTQASMSTKVFTITNADQISSLIFSWDGGAVASYPNFPSIGAWTSVGGYLNPNPAVLRISIYPAQVGQDRNALATAARTYFLYPSNGTGTNNVPGIVNYTSNGTVVASNCFVSHPLASGLTHHCNARLNIGTAVPPIGSGGAYYVSIMPIYNEASYEISALNSTDAPVTISGAQAVIDVTAKGTDVLKRIQGRASIGLACSAAATFGDAFCPSFAIESVDSICKRLVIPQDGGPATVADPYPGGVPTPGCEL